MWPSLSRATTKASTECQPISRTTLSSAAPWNQELSTLSQMIAVTCYPSKSFAVRVIAQCRSSTRSRFSACSGKAGRLCLAQEPPRSPGQNRIRAGIRLQGAAQPSQFWLAGFKFLERLAIPASPRDQPIRRSPLHNSCGSAWATKLCITGELQVISVGDQRSILD